MPTGLMLELELIVERFNLRLYFPRFLHGDFLIAKLFDARFQRPANGVCHRIRGQLLNDFRHLHNFSNLEN